MVLLFDLEHLLENLGCVTANCMAVMRRGREEQKRYLLVVIKCHQKMLASTEGTGRGEDYGLKGGRRQVDKLLPIGLLRVRAGHKAKRLESRVSNSVLST